MGCGNMFKIRWLNSSCIMNSTPEFSMWFLEAFPHSLSISSFIKNEKFTLHGYLHVISMFYDDFYWHTCTCPSSTRKTKANRREKYIIILWSRLILWNELIYWHCHFRAVIHLSFRAEMIWQKKNLFVCTSHS